MDAARQILRLSPESQILFLSQESDSEVVQEALSIGARGYLLKTHAGKEPTQYESISLAPKFGWRIIGRVLWWTGQAR
jgi:DNA-binding NarL/FixJ family response regulator